MNKYVVIVDCSAGNETVGEIWKETYIYSGNTTIDELMKDIIGDTEYSKKNIIITKPKIKIKKEENNDNTRSN